jgi:glucosylglycerate synthase
MATTNPMIESSYSAERPNGSLLVLLPASQQPQLDSILANLSASFSAEDLVIASTEGPPPNSSSSLRFVDLPAAKPSWTLTAGDFVAAHQLAQKNNVQAILLLGPEAGSLSASALGSLAHAVLEASVDLATPCYDLQPRAGLVNSSILYPLSRALFATRVRYPLAIDLGLSLRMAERLGATAQRFVALNQSEAPLWVASEAMAAGMKIDEIDVGPRDLPQPADPDLNTILPFVTGSLFSDVEAKAAFWQRARVSPPARKQALTSQPSSASDGSAEVASMLQGFRLAYTNLREIWSLVLPPNTLLGLKRLSLIDGPEFRMPENLWARIVFDFLIAYRLRTLNRGHLLGALIPLYLAWAASHINAIAAGEDPERHIEAHAAAFEAEKAYLVARWRWPDRFNP